jgi:hypothetical protein
MGGGDQVPLPEPVATAWYGPHSEHYDEPIWLKEHMLAHREEYAAARVAAETAALRAELDALKLKTRCRMGVGDGTGQLFVYGDYDSIKAAQQTVFRAETAERERDEAMGIVAVILQDGGQRAKAAGNRQAIEEAHAEWCKLVRDLDEARAEAERRRKDADRWHHVCSKAWFIDAAAFVYGLRRYSWDPTADADEVIDKIDAAILADRGGGL